MARVIVCDGKDDWRDEESRKSGNFCQNDVGAKRRMREKMEVEDEGGRGGGGSRTKLEGVMGFGV